MRDQKRIDKFCETLKVYWHMVPDWRFMQLVCNLQAQIGSDGFYYTIYLESHDNDGFVIKKEIANFYYCYGIYGGCSVYVKDLATGNSIAINNAR